MIGQLINQLLSLTDQQVNPLKGCNEVLLWSHSSVTGENKIGVGSHCHAHIGCSRVAVTEKREEIVSKLLEVLTIKEY